MVIVYSYIKYTSSLWDFYHTSSKLSGYFGPAHFTSWVAPPPVLAPPSNSQLAFQLLQSSRGTYPWSVLMKGAPPSEPAHGTHLSLLGLTSPSSPLPSTSESTVDSVTFLSLMSTYYTHSGATCLESTLRPYFDALKYSTSRVKCPECGVHALESSHHTGWLTHYHSTSLARSPHLLTQQLKALAVPKSTTFSLAAHRK